MGDRSRTSEIVVMTLVALLKFLANYRLEREIGSCMQICRCQLIDETNLLGFSSLVKISLEIRRIMMKLDSLSISLRYLLLVDAI